MADDTQSAFDQANSGLNDLIAQLQQQSNATKPQGILANVDPTMLAAAQGFLAPTRTGSFGESVGNAAGQVAAPLAAMRKAQMDNAEKIANLKLAQARLAMEEPYYSGRGAYWDARSGMPFGGVGGSEASQYNVATLAISRRLQQLDPSDPANADEIAQLNEAQRNLNKKFAATLPQSPAPAGGTGATTPPPAPAPAPSSSWSWTNPFGIFGSSGSTSQPPAAKQPPAPAPAQPKPQVQQQPDTSQPSQPVIGSTKKVQIGNDNMTATLAPDGKWYVVKDGKHYPVQE